MTLTKFEQNIYDLVKKSNGNMSAFNIANSLNVKGTTGKQIVGMTIGRMIKKGIPIEYYLKGYRITKSKGQ